MPSLRISCAVVSAAVLSASIASADGPVGVDAPAPSLSLATDRARMDPRLALFAVATWDTSFTYGVSFAAGLGRRLELLAALDGSRGPRVGARVELRVRPMGRPLRGPVLALAGAAPVSPWAAPRAEASVGYTFAMPSVRLELAAGVTHAVRELVPLVRVQLGLSY